MIWPFRKRKPVHVGPTSVDWKPGDMAECVDDRFVMPAATDPKIGDRLMVSGVEYGLSLSGKHTGFGLFFIGKPEGYAVIAFRKIVLTDTGADRTVEKARPVRVDA